MAGFYMRTKPSLRLQQKSRKYDILYVRSIRMDIEGLVKKSQQGDTQAFGQLYDLFADRLFRYVRMKTNTSHEAEDILQDVFIKAWKGLKTLRPEHLNFNAWLYTIASNTVNDRFRKMYRTPEPVELDDAFGVAAPDSPAADTAKADDMQTVKKAMDLLHPHYRQILELRFVQDLTLEETAKILGKANVTVRVLQHRALKQLKTISNKLYDI